MQVKDLVDALLNVDQDKEAMIHIEGDRVEITTVDELDDVVDLNAKEYDDKRNESNK